MSREDEDRQDVWIGAPAADAGDEPEAPPDNDGDEDE